VRPGGIVLLSLLAGACQFSVNGVTPLPNAPENTPSPADLAPTDDLVTNEAGTTAPDLAAVDLVSTAAPDLTVLSFNVGDPCSGSCGGGLNCMTWVANGYCSQACNGGGSCPSGSTCVDVGGGNRYCMLSSNNGTCARSDLSCRDCGANVCGPSTFCGGC
jgi:hypothetical protein